MNIAIDIREACKTNKTGKGQWLTGFLSELLNTDNTFLLLTDTASVPFKLNDSVVIKKFYKGPLWHIFAAAYMNKHSDYIYISPTSTLVPCLLRGKMRVATIVHDLIAFQNEPHDIKAKWIERSTLHYALKHSSNIFSVSNSTTQDIVKRFPEIKLSKIKTIFAGPFRECVQMNTPEENEILCPATLCPRKNQKRLILAYRLLSPELRAKFSLCLIGSKGWNYKEILDLVGNTQNVTWLNYVSDSVYEKKLQSCFALALPSLYEGFGMQILDALQRGIPVLTSNRGSLQEVVGNAALLADPENIDDIAKNLERIISDNDLRMKLRIDGPKQAAKFSWKRTVALFLEEVESVYS